LVCRANGTQDEDDQVVFRVQKDEAVTLSPSLEPPAVQFQCQERGEFFIGCVHENSKKSKKKRSHWKIIAAHPGDGTFWKVRVLTPPKM